MGNNKARNFVSLTVFENFHWEVIIMLEVLWNLFYNPFHPVLRLTYHLVTNVQIFHEFTSSKNYTNHFLEGQRSVFRMMRKTEFILEVKL